MSLTNKAINFNMIKKQVNVSFLCVIFLLLSKIQSC